MSDEVGLRMTDFFNEICININQLILDAQNENNPKELLLLISILKAGLECKSSIVNDTCFQVFYRLYSYAINLPLGYISTTIFPSIREIGNNSFHSEFLLVKSKDVDISP